MASYPPQGYQDPAQYGQEIAQQYDGTPQPAYDQQAATPPVPGAAPAKKKRAYAGQAFDFGAGANAGQPPAAGAVPGVQPAAYGYPQQPQQAVPQPQMGYPQPAYGDVTAQAPQAAYAQPGYGAPTGYQPPEPAYPAQGATSMLQGGVAGVTQQFAQMGMGQQPQQQQQQQQPAQPAQAAQRLNPLVPVDISVQGQPFHVADLDLPPPPVILPPNVRLE